MSSEFDCFDLALEEQTQLTRELEEKRKRAEEDRIRLEQERVAAEEEQKRAMEKANLEKEERERMVYNFLFFFLNNFYSHLKFFVTEKIN